MLKVVFDTVVFVRSLINPHGRWGKLVFRYFQSYQLFVSEPIVTEILEVLKRQELTTKFRTLEEIDFPTIIDLLGHAPTVEILVVPRVCRDPKDDKFLATAVAAKANYLVTEDNDLLDLKEYQGVRIVNAETFMQILLEYKR